MGSTKGSEPDASLLRDVHQLAGLLRDEEIVKKIPSLPWSASSRKCVQATIKSLENELLQRTYSTAHSVRENGGILELSSMERKSELEAIERKTIELQVEEEIMNKRFETFALHAIPSSVEQLRDTFASLNRHLGEQMEAIENNVTPGETFVKVEQETHKLMHKPKHDQCNKFLWSRPELLSNFSSVQNRELSALAKYCQCILEQGFVTDSSLRNTPTGARDSSNSGHFGAEIDSECINHSNDVTNSISPEVSSQYYSELKKLNTVYGELQQRKVKQLAANGALSAALKQMKKDCQSFSIATEETTKDGGSSDAQNQNSNSRDETDLPSTIQLRSEILKTRDAIEVLKQDVQAQIQELRTKTEAVSSSRSFSFTRTNTELKRHKLLNLLQQQEKVIGVLKTMKQRGVEIAELQKKEKVMFEQAHIHAQHVTAEFKQIDESLRHLDSAFDELQLGKSKRKPLTIHPDDNLSHLIYDILLQEARHMEPGVIQQPPSVHCGIKIKDEFDPEKDAFEDSKQWFQNVFSHANEDSIGNKKSNTAIACDQITKLVTQLNDEIAHTTKQLDQVLKNNRSELVHRLEAVQNSEGTAAFLKTQTSQNVEERVQTKKELKRLEMGLGSCMEQYDGHRRQMSSDPVARKESEAFVDFFAHPNRAALNIKRWKSQL